MYKGQLSLWNDVMNPVVLIHCIGQLGYQTEAFLLVSLHISGLEGTYEVSCPVLS